MNFWTDLFVVVFPSALLAARTKFNFLFVPFGKLPGHMKGQHMRCKYDPWTQLA